MQEQSIILTGIGHFFPETVLDNHFFEELDIGTTAQWIEERVGIKERRSILTREQIKDLRYARTDTKELRSQGHILSYGGMLRKPWLMALERSKLSNDTALDLAIGGTSVPDWDIPANGCAAVGELGITSNSAFDVNSACSTFVVNLHVARSLMLTGQALRVGIFNAERYTTRTDYSDRSSCILFGDSASATILESNSKSHGLKLIDTMVESNAAGYIQVQLPTSGNFSQNGKAVQKFAVTKTISAAQSLMEKHKLSAGDISYFIAHQANLRMLTYAAEKLGFTQDQHLYNVETRGNQGATGAPTVLSEHWSRYKIGDYILMSVVGSGLTWGSALFQVV